ncbi:MAG: D-alanyl-D-alanine carboxypeptidase [Clostridia bacterium]|nr:D-alanyl-D-alanine carboxypeptidase [Clostridia bacterium]
MNFSKILALSFALLLVIFSLAAPLPVAAAEAPTPSFETDGKAACVFDVTHSRFIYKKNADEVLNTSTSAKIMMGLIACEQLKDRLSERVTITESMIAGVSGYSMKLKAGETVTVKDLLYGAICASYNDAAYVLAHVISGSTEDFVALMNSRARELGANQTSYTNPLGYPDNSAMVTTLNDTLKIATAAYYNALYMQICSAVSYGVPDTNMSDERFFYNRNYLLSVDYQYNYYNKKCSGMNAGISGEAGGWSIVTVAHDDGADLICIVLGGTEDENGINAYETVNKLVLWACYEYDTHTIFEAGSDIGTVDVGLTAFGSEKAVYVAAEKISVYIPKHSHPNLTYHLELTEEELNAPLTAGDPIGTVSIYCNGQLVGQAPVAIKQSYEVNGVMVVIKAIGDYTKSRAFIITLVALAILLPTALILRSRKTQKRGYRMKY